MRYKVIQANDATELEKLVAEEIKVGWRPQGGVSSFQMYERDHYDNRIHHYFLLQAMVFE